MRLRGGGDQESQLPGLAPDLWIHLTDLLPLGAVHNIQPDVPVENILAMYEHARAYTPSYQR